MRYLLNGLRAGVLVLGIMLLAYVVATPGSQVFLSAAGGFLIAVYVTSADRAAS